MSICYFKCDKCYREYSSSFFQEIRCSCGGWYLREYWKCMLGHKNDKADYGYPCAKCRKEAERNIMIISNSVIQIEQKIKMMKFLLLVIVLELQKKKKKKKHVLYFNYGFKMGK